MLWSQAEQAAYARCEEVRAAMSTTGANGGFMIPLSLDPAVLAGRGSVVVGPEGRGRVLLKSDGAANSLRQLATVRQTVTNTWSGITSAGVSAEWKTEGAQVADASPTVGNPSIPVFLGDAFVQWSFEVGMDAGGDFLGEISMLLNDGAAQLQATAYTTGNGTTAPQGIVTGLAGTSSEINTTGSEALDKSDRYALRNALPARFSANASFLSHIATCNTYRKMESANGALLFPKLCQTQPYLLGKGWHELSNMDGSINAAATANNYALIYGDVRAGFFIVDRVGSSLELIPNLFGADGRPTGQRGALLWFRTGSEVVVPQALRLLDVPTTA